MLLKKPKIFKNFPEIVFGFSKRREHISGDPFNFNLSYTVGDNEDKVKSNRNDFFTLLGLETNNVVIQRQIHSDIVNIIDAYIPNLEGDALITRTKILGLGISTADCINIYLYDPSERVISAVHSGWEGTEKRILGKVITLLIEECNVDPKNLFAYFGPSISQDNYEVGQSFKNKFDEKYLMPFEHKYKLDLKRANFDILKRSGVPAGQIEVSDSCTFANPEFHSFRRDKSGSGRAIGIIAMR